MFIIVNRIGDSITGSLNGESFGISFSQGRYDEMKRLEAKQHTVNSVQELQALVEEFKPLTKESLKELVEHKTPWLFVNRATGRYFLKVGSGNKTAISSEALPQAFVDRIVTSVEQNLDFMPLIKAWARFLRNPNYSSDKAQRFANYINNTYTNQDLVQKFINEDGVSEKVAIERATTFQTPITQEGLICTYKVSAELHAQWELDSNNQPVQKDSRQATIDPISGLITYKPAEYVEDRIFYPVMMGLKGGDEFFCGDTPGHIIKVGQRHYLPDWEQVNTNDNQSAVKGLHTGNLDYIRSFQHDGTETHNVFVDPANIGAFTNDGTGALRVKEYFVHSSFAGVNRSIYHSSEYAKLTDAAYAQLFADAVEAHKQEVSEVEVMLQEMDALQTI